LAGALMANCTLRSLWLGGNSIGNEGAAALARALATNRSLSQVCLATGGPEWVGIECWRWPLLCPHTSRITSVMVVAQLRLDGNCIDDAGISAVVGVLADSGTLDTACDGAAQRCGLHVHVRVPCPHWLCAARAWQMLCGPSSMQHVERGWCECACALAGCRSSQAEIACLPLLGGQLLPRSQQCHSHASCRPCSSGCQAAI